MTSVDAVSIVIPVYRDVDALARALSDPGLTGAEIVVAATPEERETLAGLRARHPQIRWIEAPRGRARQMNAGAAAASGTWILFLHADTRLPAEWRQVVADADRDASVSIGCFRFALDSSSPAARVLELGVRLRVLVFGLPYGDQALFVRRDAFVAAGGYADIPIMEDVDLVRRLRTRGRLFRARHPAVTSARKWEQEGWIARTATHLRLILLYLAGVPPHVLIMKGGGETARAGPASKG